jgi:hypothetical protein
MVKAARPSAALLFLIYLICAILIPSNTILNPSPSKWQEIKSHI